MRTAENLARMRWAFVFSAVCLGLLLLKPVFYPMLTPVSKAEFFYTRGVTKAQAEKVVTVLQSTGFLVPDRAIRIELKKAGDRYQLIFLVEGPLTAEARKAFQLTAELVSSGALDEQPVDLVFLNKWYQPQDQLTFAPPNYVSQGMARVTFEAGVTRDEAEAVREAFVKDGFLSGKSLVIVHLRRQDGALKIGFAVKDEFFKDTRMDKNFEVVARDAAAALKWTQATDFELLDSAGNTRRVLPVISSPSTTQNR